MGRACPKLDPFIPIIYRIPEADQAQPNVTPTAPTAKTTMHPAGTHSYE
jgi:hypothetical protein